MVVIVVMVVPCMTIGVFSGGFAQFGQRIGFVVIELWWFEDNGSQFPGRKLRTATGKQPQEYRRASQRQHLTRVLI